MSIKHTYAHISIDMYVTYIVIYVVIQTTNWESIFAKHIIDKGSYPEKYVKTYKSINKYRESHKHWTRCLMKTLNEKDIRSAKQCMKRFPLITREIKNIITIKKKWPKGDNITYSSGCIDRTDNN